jgi:hypothetical protein
MTVSHRTMEDVADAAGQRPIESSEASEILSSELVDEPSGASAASEIAAVAYSLDADIER